MTHDAETVKRVALRHQIARIIMLDHLELLHDFEVDGDLYRQDPECAESAYATADKITAAIDAMQPPPDQT